VKEGKVGNVGYLAADVDCSPKRKHSTGDTNDGDVGAEETISARGKRKRGELYQDVDFGTKRL